MQINGTLILLYFIEMLPCTVSKITNSHYVFTETMADDLGNTPATHVIYIFHLHFQISYICPQIFNISLEIIFIIYRYLHLYPHLDLN